MLILIWGKTIESKIIKLNKYYHFVVIKVTIISEYITIMSLMHKNHITKISELTIKMLNLQMIIYFY